MGWKSVARSFGVPTTTRGVIRRMGASSRSSSSWERDARRRQRELERQQKELTKMQELERARYEVNVYENYIEVIRSIHKECGDSWNWTELQASNPPHKPQLKNENELAAQKKHDGYVPSFLDKLFHRINKKRAAFKKEIEKAKESDQFVYKSALSEYEEEYQEWTKVTDLARRICSDDLNAYDETIKQINPFEEIEKIGSSISFDCKSKDLVTCNLQVPDEKIIPKEAKSLLKSGKLSVKQIPQNKYYDLYQDYVCGCVLRIAREAFALLPIEMIIVNAKGNWLSKKTGHIENVTILSAAMPRKTIESLNFDSIDPSDSMRNFLHKMDLKKGQGFNPVEDIKPEELVERTR